MASVLPVVIFKKLGWGVILSNGGCCFAVSSQGIVKSLDHKMDGVGLTEHMNGSGSQGGSSGRSSPTG